LFCVPTHASLPDHLWSRGFTVGPDRLIVRVRRGNRQL
jgi:ribosomal protein L31E